MAESDALNSASDGWFQALVGFVPPIDRKTRAAGHLKKSRFFRAGPGKVWASRTFRDVLLLTSKRTLAEAFLGWRRHQGFIGAYFDHRADLSKSSFQFDPTKAGDREHRTKEADKRGVPGATFLALMSLPMFPVRSPGPFLAETVGWSDTRAVPKGFLWPVWGQMLDLPAIVALADHPDVAASVTHPRDDRLAGLGLSAVFRSLRISAGNNDAALSPPKALWESHR